MRQQKYWVILFCAGVLYLTLFYQLGTLAFMGADEPRYAGIGEEMFLSGDYLTPTLNGRPWLEKPPLLFWLEAVSFSLFGVHEGSARLPGALLALVSLLGVGLLARELQGTRCAFFTVLILGTSGLFFVFARAASTDTILVSMLSAAMVCGYQATRRDSNLWAIGAGLTLGLAVLAKGPVAMVLFVGVFGLYFLLIQELHWSALQVALLAISSGLTAVPWFWEVWKENGYSFVATFWINHHLARFFTDLHHHSQPFWYYLPVLLIGFFPWIFFLGSALVRGWRRRGHLLEPRFRPELFLWLWVGVPFVFFSISQSKLAGYVLPVFPPLAILIALEWDHWIEGDLISQRLMRTQLIVMGGFALLFSGALLWGFYFIYGAPVIGILLAVPIVTGAGLALFEVQRRKPPAIFLSLVAGMTLFASLAYWKAAPVLDDYHSARDLSQLILPRISQEEPLILYRYFHHTAGYYTNHQVTPEAVNDLDALHDYFKAHPQRQFHILTQEDGFKDLDSLEAKLIQQQGNLYLLEATSR
ncbi:MAG: glycosyltransferase family 39 protein [Acidobacteriota bacterium]